VLQVRSIGFNTNKKIFIDVKIIVSFVDILRCYG